MVSALSKKNTLEQTAFRLTDSGFIYRGKQYDFEDVIEASRFRQVLQTKVVMVGSDYTHGISILFVMTSGDRIQLTEQPTWLSNSKIDKIEEIEKIFAIVSEKTFQNRAKKYLAQVEGNGFFEYAGWHFFPKERKILECEKNRAYPIDSIRLLKSYGFVQVVKKEESFGDKITKKLRRTVGINTIRNTDVFFCSFRAFFQS